MHKKSSALACGIALALSFATARSENLLQVYQAAAKSDPTILEADARRLAALEVKPQARGALLPQLSADGSLRHAQSRTARRRSTRRSIPVRRRVIAIVRNQQETDADFWNVRGQLTQTVFDWDQWQTLQRADSQVALAEANYRAAEQDLLVRVAGRYFDVLAADDTLTAAEATLQSVNRQLEQAEKRFEVGLIAITDVQEARAAHDSATAGVILAKRSLATAQEFLRELTGEEYTSLVKPADDMALNEPQPADEQTWVDKATAQNLNVIAARLDVDIAKDDIKIAQGGHMPRVELFGEYYKYDANATQTNNGLTGPADNNQTQDTIGLQVHAADLQRRRHAVAGAPAGLPASRGPRAPRWRDAQGRARDARLLSRRDRRKGARRGTAAGREVEPDRARGHRGRVRRRHAHHGGRARRAPAPVRGGTRLRAQPLRLPDQRGAAQVRSRSARAGRSRRDQRPAHDAGDPAADASLPRVLPVDQRQHHLDQLRDRAAALRDDFLAAGTVLPRAFGIVEVVGDALRRVPRGCARCAARPPGRSSSAMSWALCVCGPDRIGMPSAAGSSRLCPPIGTRLPPTNATSAAA